jgi:hypothetical protein
MVFSLFQRSFLLNCQIKLSLRKLRRLSEDKRRNRAGQPDKPRIAARQPRTGNLGDPD